MTVFLNHRTLMGVTQVCDSLSTARRCWEQAYPIKDLVFMFNKGGYRVILKSTGRHVGAIKIMEVKTAASPVPL